MAIRLGTVPIYVKDQAEALRFYVDALGFEKRMDSPMGEGLRWLTVAPPGEATDFVLASGFGGDDWEARIGHSHGCVLLTDDIDETYRTWRDRGVQFTEAPTLQEWGAMQALFNDPDGNGFVLVQLPD